MEGLEEAWGGVAQSFLGLGGPCISPTPSLEPLWTWEGQCHPGDGPASLEVCPGPGVGQDKHSVIEEPGAQPCLPLGPLTCGPFSYQCS